MYIKISLTAILTLLFALSAVAQQPPRPPRQGPPNGPERGLGRPEGGDWARPHDANKNGNIEADEFKDALDRTFASIDANGNGTLEVIELQQARPKRGERAEGRGGDRMLPGQPMHEGSHPGDKGKAMLPPFFFADRIDGEKAVTRAEFDSIVRGVLGQMDKDNDGALSREELRNLPVPNRPDRPGRPDQPPPPPNARFIGAELRFGDKPVKGQPFSAETVIEDTKLLFDGTTVKNTRTGAIYRDGNGRVRREQPFEMVGGISIVGTGNKPQKLVFIHDFAAKTQIFLDENGKVARRTKMPENQPRPADLEDRPGATTVSDGTKTIEGVSCNLTRTEHEIPAGQIGNEKPLKVFSEKCFSPELQLVIMSLHQDPVGGLHVFTLKNIKKGEPHADLFAVPAGYRVEN